ncbi:ABC transporter permease [Paenibacillus sp. y28]|uniref:ABC transporter permease n=1 Tax=Paenibacillus sp. y28 TaxID=3129110 RepID=UPI003016B467
MRFSELIGMAMRTVTSSPMRTFLTMLGVIIGVSSVVTLVAIGQGTSDKVASQIQGLGTNLITVSLTGFNNGRATQLDYNELMQLETLPEFKYIAPMFSRGSSNVKYERTSTQLTVTGTNDRYFQIQGLELAKGRLLAPADLEFRNRVAVIGSGAAQTLFGFVDPVGQDINMDGFVYTIVGLLEEKGSNTSGTSIDDTLMVPLETVRRDFKLGSIRTTYIEAASKDEVTTAQATMKQYLVYKFKSESGFTIQNQDEMLKTANSVNEQMNYMLVGVACISLVVGGIGIMNIMLVTVSERTREIGIRKSIGAKRRTILMQFLVESVVISGLGGLVGLGIGIGISLLIPVFYANQATKLSLDISLYAFLFSVVIGVVFGLYPANKASKLRPIDALRTD